MTALRKKSFTTIIIKPFFFKWNVVSSRSVMNSSKGQLNENWCVKQEVQTILHFDMSIRVTDNCKTLKKNHNVQDAELNEASALFVFLKTATQIVIAKENGNQLSPFKIPEYCDKNSLLLWISHHGLAVIAFLVGKQFGRWLDDLLN